MFLQSFYEYFTEEKLKKENIAAMLNGKLKMAPDSGYKSEIMRFFKAWMFLKVRHVQEQMNQECFPVL
jgi:hypothetical protein